eukprot:PhF_6_TR11663/c0_g1_i3/m.18843/K03234/EEF2; elongation factor 2
MEFMCLRPMMLLGISDGLFIPYDVLYDVLDGILVNIPDDESRFAAALSCMMRPQLIRSVSLCGSTTHLCVALNRLIFPHTTSSITTRFLETTGVLCYAHHHVSIPGIDSYLLYIGEHRTWDQHVIETMRMYDGALIIIDCEDRHNPEVEDNIVRVVSCAHHQGIRVRVFFDNMLSFLTIDGVDVCSIENKCARVYRWMCHLLDRINHILHGSSTSMVDPVAGTALFGSSMEGWAFTLMDVATQYASKYRVAPEKLVSRLWGDNWFVDHKWYTRENVNNIEDNVTFVTLCMVPATLTTREKRIKQFPGDVILQRFLFDVFPDPVSAAKYFGRGSTYVNPGPKMGTSPVLCDPTASTVMICTDVVHKSYRHTPQYRILSGHVTAHIPLYRVDGKVSITVNRMLQLFEGRIVTIPEDVVLPCGNFVGLLSHLLQAKVTYFGWSLVSQSVSSTWDGTLRSTTRNKSCIHQYPTIMATLPDLDALHTLKLSLLGNLMPTQITEYDDDFFLIRSHTLYEHKQVIAELKLYVGSSHPVHAIFDTITPVPMYYESVGTTCDGPLCLVKSPNKHNRFFVSASALTDEEIRVVSSANTSPQLLREVNDVLIKVSPRNENCTLIAIHNGNILQYHTSTINKVNGWNDVVDIVARAFAWGVMEGPIANHPIRNVRFTIQDVTLYKSGQSQLVHTFRRVIRGCILSSSPVLFEPFFRLSSSPEWVSCRCLLADEDEKGDPDHHVQGVEWRMVPGDLRDSTSQTYQIASSSQHSGGGEFNLQLLIDQNLDKL